jgi:hypothetical protein
LNDLLRDTQKIYVREDKEKQNKRLRLCSLLWVRPLERKALLKELDTTIPKSLRKEGRVHRPQGGRKKINVVDVENQDISDKNVLKGQRKRG